jgi:hypothetical protein
MWFLVIESRSYVNTINVSNIEQFEEAKDERLNIVYYTADAKLEDKFVKKIEIYDCCQNELILKTFNGIRQRIIE